MSSICPEVEIIHKQLEDGIDFPTSRETSGVCHYQIQRYVAISIPALVSIRVQNQFPANNKQSISD